MLKKPFEIVDDILVALDKNDCPAVHLHMDDLQEVLVAKIMAGDFTSQAPAFERLQAGIRESLSIKDDALIALLARAGIDNRTALKIIQRHDDPLVNEAVCQNLMLHKPTSMNGRVDDFYLATYWLGSGDYGIFKSFASSLLDKPCDKLSLQDSILKELFGVCGEHKDIYYHWVAQHQDKIIDLSSGALDNFKAHPMFRGVKLFDAHLPKIARLIVLNSRQSPSRSDLYDMRTRVDVILTDERLLAEWAGDHSTMGWSDDALQSLMIYHLAFEDSPQPMIIGGEATEAARALVQALYFLREKGVEPNPGHMSQILALLLTNLTEEENLEEGLDTLKRSEFKRHFLVNHAFRDHQFGGDLGL